MANGNQTALAVRSVPSANDTMTLAQMMAQSGFFSDTRDAAQAVVKILAGQELGFGPVASMTGVYIVKGRVTLSANMIAAALKRSNRYDYRVKELTDQVCRIEFYENGQPVGISEFTVKDAQTASLAGGDNWKKFPRNMLFARAISNGAKWYCADIFGGPLYTPDELGAEVNVTEDGEMTVKVLPSSQPPPMASIAPPANGTNGHSIDTSTGEILTPPTGGHSSDRVVCVDCHQPIVDVTIKGKAYPAAELVKLAVKAFGVPVCQPCGAERKKAGATNGK